MLAALPNGTFVRVTGFTFSLRSGAEVTAFMDLLDTLNGLDASNGGVNRAQMNGTIRLERSDAANGTPVTVTGALLAAWRRRYPSVSVIPERIANDVYYYSHDGTELVHTETVYNNAAAVYDGFPVRASSESGRSYVFLGWASATNSATADAVLTNVSESLAVYAVYELVQDIRPVVAVETYATGIGASAVVQVTDWGSYSEVVSMSAVGAEGSVVSTLTGNGIVSVSDDTVTIAATAAYYTGVTEWALHFADNRGRGGLTCSVPFRLKNLPTVTVRKKTSAAKTADAESDPIILDVSSFGDYPNVTEFGFYYDYHYHNLDGSGTSAFMSVTSVNNISVSGNVVTLIPEYPGGSTNPRIATAVRDSYVKFSNASNTDTVTLVLDMFDIGT